MWFILHSHSLFFPPNLHMNLFFNPAAGFWRKKIFYIHKIYWNKIFCTVNRTTKNRNKTNGRKYFSFSLLLLLLLHSLFFWAPMCGRAKICNIIIILHISSIYESRDQHPQMYIYRYILVMGHSTFFPHSVNIIIIIIIILSTNISSFIYIHMQIIMHT